MNKRRRLLGLALFEEWAADTKLDEGLIRNAISPELKKASALRDLRALSDALVSASTPGESQSASIATDLNKLDSDP